MYTHTLRCTSCMWIEMHCKQMYTYTHPYVCMLYQKKKVNENAHEYVHVYVLRKQIDVGLDEVDTTIRCRRG